MKIGFHVDAFNSAYFSFDQCLQWVQQNGVHYIECGLMDGVSWLHGPRLLAAYCHVRGPRYCCGGKWRPTAFSFHRSTRPIPWPTWPTNRDVSVKFDTPRQTTVQ